jgi:phosphatidylserine/phosphatidylglycerophosphate/cardiolipin synthase-like enzyme
MKSWLLRALIILFSYEAQGSITTYFNQKEGGVYTDPYRLITRQGDNLEEVLLSQIHQAKKSIYIAVQEFRLPLVASALIEKKKQGVDVRLVIEHDYNFNVLSQRDSANEGEYEASKLNELRAFVDVNKDGKIQLVELQSRDAIYMLQRENIKILDDTSDSSKGSGLMHHKFMIIDGKTTIVSTANFTMSCIHGDVLSPKSRGNSNSMTLINSLNVAQMFMHEFLQLWGNGIRGNFGQNKAYRGPMTTTVMGKKITIQFSPTSERFNWEESVNGLIARQIKKAKISIEGALFVFSDQFLTNAMLERHLQGVEVGFVGEAKFAFRDYSEFLDLMGLEMLSSRCVYEPFNQPWIYPANLVGTANLSSGDVMHHKFGVIDKKTVIVGSQNWSSAANYTNDETLVVIEDDVVANQFTQEYSRLKKTARLGTPRWLDDQIRASEQACSYISSY